MSSSIQSLQPRFESLRPTERHTDAREPTDRSSRTDKEAIEGLPLPERDLWQPHPVGPTPMLANAATTRASLPQPEAQGVRVGGPQIRAVQASSTRAVSNGLAPKAPTETQSGRDGKGLNVDFAVNPQIAYIRAHNYAIRAGLSREEAETLATEVREIHRQQHVTSGRTQEILGQYRGKPAIHFLDPETGLNVVTDTAGSFVTGWKLSVQQLEDVLTKGWLW